PALPSARPAQPVRLLVAAIRSTRRRRPATTRLDAAAPPGPPPPYPAPLPARLTPRPVQPATATSSGLGSATLPRPLERPTQPGEIADSPRRNRRLTAAETQTRRRGSGDSPSWEGRLG